MEWLKSNVFTGMVGMNTMGVVGVIVMFLGAILSLAPGNKTPERIVCMKLIGMALVIVGTIIVIAFGKY